MSESQTKQIDLNGQKIDIETQEVEKTTLKIYAPWYVLSLSESAQDKLRRITENGTEKDLKNYILCHMKPRHDKLPDGKEGETFQQSIEILKAAILTI